MPLTILWPDSSAHEGGADFYYLVGSIVTEQLLVVSAILPVEDKIELEKISRFPREEILGLASTFGLKDKRYLAAKTDFLQLFATDSCNLQIAVGISRDGRLRISNVVYSNEESFHVVDYASKGRQRLSAGTSKGVIKAGKNISSVLQKKVWANARRLQATSDFNSVLQQIQCSYQIRPSTSSKDALEGQLPASREKEHHSTFQRTLELALLSLFLKITSLLNVHFPPWLFQGACLKDLSATAQQVGLRLEYWAILFSKRNHVRPTTSSYRSQHDSLLILMDYLLGFLATYVMYDNSAFLAEYIDQWIVLSINSSKASLMWLMGAPAGLKLNSELTSFLGEIFLYLMQLWSEWISLSRPILQDVIRVVALTGIFGISTPICIASDLLSMCTLHLHLCYIVASKVYYWQVKAILFLFTLFRGKRKNTLRNRVDSADYGLDQLLLGTMFFALLIFLFPTVTVYYAFFSMVRISVVIAQAIPELLLVVINHFPLHQLMRNYTEFSYARVPSSAAETALDVERRTCSSIVYMNLEAVPRNHDMAFYQYDSLWMRTRYLLSDILGSIFIGRNIQSIPRMDVGRILR